MYKADVDRIGVTKETKGKLKEMAREQGVSIVELMTKIVGGLTPPAPPPQPSVQKLPRVEEAQELLPAEEAQELLPAEEAQELLPAEEAQELPLATPRTDAPKKGAALELEKVSATKVIVNIRLGPASPGQRQAWSHFWKELIYEVKAGDKERTVNWNTARFENETSP